MKQISLYSTIETILNYAAYGIVFIIVAFIAWLVINQAMSPIGRTRKNNIHANCREQNELINSKNTNP